MTVRYVCHFINIASLQVKPSNTSQKDHDFGFMHVAPREDPG
jgi:hypothetical protein